MPTPDHLDAAPAAADPSQIVQRSGQFERLAPSRRSPGDVVVTIKRRRVERTEASSDLQPDQDVSVPQPKAPRVFRLRSDMGEHVGVVGPDERSPDDALSAPGMVGVASGDAIVRRRRPRDPVRAPGKVTSFVFARSQDGRDRVTEPRRCDNNFMGPAGGVGYAKVMAGLDAVQEILDTAFKARDFRIL